MTTLFRRIRQKLIESGSLTKYLFYALGEIALVMIGILLALQVNNWNEGRSRSAEEKRIISDIIEESKEAVASRNEIASLYSNERRILSVALDKIFSSGSEPITNNECIAIFRSHIIRWNPVNISTLEEIVTSGKISIIKDSDFRKQLVEFRNFYKSNEQYVRQTITQVPVLVDQFPNLIIRDWSPEINGSIFTCNDEAMRKDRFFTAQLQSNHGRMSLPENIAGQEVDMLIQIQNNAKSLITN